METPGLKEIWEMKDLPVKLIHRAKATFFIICKCALVTMTTYSLHFYDISL